MIDEIGIGSTVRVDTQYAAEHREHHGKNFIVLDIDDEDYCELEWVNIHAKERIAYIPKNHLCIAN